MYVSEVCPHCDATNDLEWNVETQGYIIKCQECGKEMMLCDECLCHEDSKCCDWHVEGDKSVCFRGTHKMWRKE